jgi:hypothetical protein
MPPTKEIPFAVIDAQELARWVDAQPETWWTVDGDPLLTAELDFPCPAQELSAALRKHAGNLFVLAPGSARHGEVITGGQLDSFSQRDRRYNERSFLLRWEDEDQPWLLSEDTASSKQQE